MDQAVCQLFEVVCAQRLACRGNIGDRFGAQVAQDALGGATAVNQLVAGRSAHGLARGKVRPTGPARVNRALAEIWSESHAQSLRKRG